MKFFYSLLFIALPLWSYAQSISDDQLDTLALRYARQSFDELADFLSLPNDAHYPADIERNVAWSERAFAARGFETQRLATEAAPLLVAQRTYPGAQKTVLVYLQVDGQPVDTSQWQQSNPYQATLKALDGTDGWQSLAWDRLTGKINPDWRIFARSTSDAKGPVVAFLYAVDILNDHDYTPNFNLKVVMDFEEELGSPHLPAAVDRYRDELAADLLVIFDGPMHSTNRPTLVYGARGIAKLTLEVFGPRVPQHSGHFGNYVPNPALRLSHLLSSMADTHGRVRIPGWYDGITLTTETKQLLAQVPDDEATIRQQIGIATSDSVADSYQEALQYPALGILGLRSGWVGAETRTIIPSSAVAEMNIRLVKETDGERMVRLVRDFVRQQGYHLVDSVPTEAERRQYPQLARFDALVSYGAFRTPIDSEIGDWLRAALQRAFGPPPVQIRTHGGSIPIAPFVNTLDIPAVIVPTVNKDNNQHSPNENIRVGNYIDGIKTITAILTQTL